MATQFQHTYTYMQEAEAVSNTAGNPVSNAVSAPTPVSNPVTEHPVVAAIKANFNNLVDVVDTKFHFKKITDETTGLESKRPTVEIKLPRPSVEGIIDIIGKGGKELDLLLEAVGDVVLQRAREIINDKEDITQDNFPLDELSWEKIANLPKAERRGGGISKELWDDFAKDYVAIMPAVTNKPVEKIALAAKVFLNKFNAVKTDKKVLSLLKGQLALYVTSSPNAENFVDCVDFLDKKAQSLIDADSSNLLDNL